MWFHLLAFALPQGPGYYGVVEGLSSNRLLSVAWVAPFQSSLEENLLHGCVMLELSASPIQACWGSWQPLPFHIGKRSPRCCPGRAAFKPLERFFCCSNDSHRCLHSGFYAGVLLSSQPCWPLLGLYLHFCWRFLFFFCFWFLLWYKVSFPSVVLTHSVLDKHRTRCGSGRPRSINRALVVVSWDVRYEYQLMDLRSSQSESI